MSSIIDIEMVVAVDVKSLKLQQEFLQDALGLEGDHAVLVPLVPAVQHYAVHLMAILVLTNNFQILLLTVLGMLDIKFPSLASLHS